MTLTPQRNRKVKGSPGRQGGPHKHKKTIYLNEFTSDPIYSLFEILITQNNRCYLNNIGRIRSWNDLKEYGISEEIIIMIKLKYGSIL